MEPTSFSAGMSYPPCPVPGLLSRRYRLLGCLSSQGYGLHINTHALAVDLQGEGSFIRGDHVCRGWRFRACASHIESAPLVCSWRRAWH